MPRRAGKNIVNARKKIETRPYKMGEAADVLKAAHFAKFDETVELVINLGVDPKHSDQMVRGTVVLPHGLGKSKRVLVLASGEKIREAQEAGADTVGEADLAAKVQEGWLEFDVAIATPDMMGVVGRLGKVLGPRGLMPNPKVGTVTADVARAVREAKAGKVEFRVEKAGIVHVPVGKASFEARKLLENTNAILETILRARPATAKGTYLRGVSISTTVGPGIPLDAAAITAAHK